MHAKDIATVLEDLKKNFAEEGIPFALLGALAMRYYNYVRHTEDIDILTTKEGLQKIHDHFVGRGIVPRGKGLRNERQKRHGALHQMLRETEHYVNIDVITAGEHAGSQDSPVEYPHPESDAFVSIEGVRVPRLERLIEFKLACGIWGNRLDDLGNVFNLIKANKLNERFAKSIHPALKVKFLELLKQAKSEKEIE